MKRTVHANQDHNRGKGADWKSSERNLLSSVHGSAGAENLTCVTALIQETIWFIFGRPWQSCRESRSKDSKTECASVGRGQEVEKCPRCCLSIYCGLKPAHQIFTPESAEEKQQGSPVLINPLFLLTFFIKKNSLWNNNHRWRVPIRIKKADNGTDHPVKPHHKV